MYKWLSFLLIVVSGSIYQIMAEKVETNMNPFASLCISYLFAMITAIICYFVTKDNTSLFSEIKKANLFSMILGVAICFLELGFILSYRNGFSVALLSPLVSVSTMTVLAIVGIVFYKEPLSALNIFGLLLAGTGVFIAMR